MILSLQTRILLLITGTVMGLAAVVLLSLAFLTNREIDRSVQSDVHATGSVLADFVQERALRLSDQSLLLARQPVLRATIGTHDAATIMVAAHDCLQQVHADAVLITDQDGRVLSATDAPVRESDKPIDEVGVRAALRGEPWSSVIARGRRLVLAVSVPVKTGGVIQGSFTAYSAIDANVARGLKRTLGTEVAFVLHGETVAASGSLPQRLPTPHNVPKVITLGGVRYFALYSPLPGTNPTAQIGFVVLHSYDAAMARYAPLRIAFAAISALALTLALTVGVAVARGITQPLDGVVHAARELSEGKWPDRFEIRRNDEIGLLQSVFNEMTTSMRASRKQLLALIDTDPLTGLQNHRRFQERLGEEVSRCIAAEEPLVLLIFDLDHFHEFNRRYGHAVGDEALNRVARILRDCMPESAILARYGGEEFAALVPQEKMEQAEQHAERVRAAVATSLSLIEKAPLLSISVGCAELGRQTAQPETLLLAAELAVSQAKQLGRNRVCRFDSVPGVENTADPYHLQKFLQDGSFATIQALAAAVDAKDPYTEGHSRRVAHYASELARYIGLPQDEVELLYTMGTLHDVGKIGVPDAVLTKPGRLDEQERALIETHPILGEVIVRKAPLLAPMLPGVRHHHERWDGQGYPDRLVGAEIPFMARVLAIADTFDAITSDRPYRKALTLEVALREIAQGAGTQFDPELASAFVTLVGERNLLSEIAGTPRAHMGETITIGEPLDRILVHTVAKA